MNEDYNLEPHPMYKDDYKDAATNPGIGPMDSAGTAGSAPAPDIESFGDTGAIPGPIEQGNQFQPSKPASINPGLPTGMPGAQGFAKETPGAQGFPNAVPGAQVFPNAVPASQGSPDGTQPSPEGTLGFNGVPTGSQGSPHGMPAVNQGSMQNPNIQGPGMNNQTPKKYPTLEPPKAVGKKPFA